MRDVGIRIPSGPGCPAEVKEAGANDDGVGQVCSMAAACTFEDGSQWQGGLTANSGGSIPGKAAAAL
jgi:hypothetical protein